MNCKICDKVFDINRMGNHIRSAHKEYTVKQYYDTYIRKGLDGFCQICGKETRFWGLSNLRYDYNSAYSRYCVQKCYTIKQTMYFEDILCKKCNDILPSKNPNKNKSGFCESCFQEMGIVGRKHKKGVFISKRQGISIKYQSGWELKFLESFEKSTEILSFNRPSFHISYVYKGTNHKYYPDFLVEYKNQLSELLEVKPTKFLQKSVIKAKALAARAYCEQNDLVYKFLTECQLEGL